MKFRFNARLIARQALLAAFYAVITYTAGSYSYGPIQFRYSELLNWFAFYDPKNVIGLSVGCLISNFGSPFGAIDIVVGTLGTVIATILMARTRSRLLASIWPAAVSFLYSGEMLFLGEITSSLFLIVTAQIMLSELIIVAGAGLPIFAALERNDRFMRVMVDSTMEPHKETFLRHRIERPATNA